MMETRAELPFTGDQVGLFRGATKPPEADLEFVSTAEADLAQVAQPSGGLPAGDQTCGTSRAETDEALAPVEDGDVWGISGSRLSVVRRAT